MPITRKPRTEGMIAMRHFAKLLLPGALLAALALPAYAQTAPKIGFIDSRAIIAQAPGAQEAQKAFEQDMARYQAELETLENELKTQLDAYEKQQVTLSPDARRQRQEELRTKQMAYTQRAQQLEQQAADRQAELVEPIMGRINTVISQIREAEGYALIFDVAGGAVVAADPALNLTDKVLAQLGANPQNARSGNR